MTEKLGTALGQRLQSAQTHDLLDVNVFLTGEPAADALRTMEAIDETAYETARPAVAFIKERSADLQKDFIGFLSAAQTNVAFTEIDSDVSIPEVAREPDYYWINNSVAAQVSPSMLRQILERPDVAHVELTRHVDIEELLDVSKKKSRPGTRKKVASRQRARAPVAAVNPTWSVQLVNAPLLWGLGLTGEGVLAGLIDTGVNYSHPDLAGHMWDGGAQFPHHGYDFENGDDDPMDENGHGTATAGQVAGDGTAGETTGIAPKATVMALRVGGQERNYWKAFEFAIEHKAHLISMSMSWKYPRSPDYPGWRRACETLLAVGMLHANSIGNQGNEPNKYPIPYNIATPGNCPPPRLHPLQEPLGGLSSAIACGATDDQDQLADFSGRGPGAWESSPYTDYPYNGGAHPGLIKPDVCAPGPGTRSCNWRYDAIDPRTRPYRSFGGTSAATPHIGGCLALLAHACLRSGRPIVPARMQEALENSAVRISGQSRDKEDHYGAGRVDVYMAYKYGESRSWWT